MHLHIQNLSKSYGKQNVLKDASFSFEQGKIYSILGRNGAGKTVT
jgi:ABC-2 type transport system ATP-binding protein